MGWIFAFAFAVLSLAALWFTSRRSRPALELGGALILAGLAGYAWQGSPDMLGQPLHNSSQQ